MSFIPNPISERSGSVTNSFIEGAREGESERGSETETRERGIWEVVEAGFRVVKSQPMGETVYFGFVLFCFVFQMVKSF